MLDKIGSLLLRNAYKVFGERDPIPRAPAIEAIWHLGRSGMEGAVGALRAEFPDPVCAQIGNAETLRPIR